MLPLCQRSCSSWSRGFQEDLEGTGRNLTVVSRKSPASTCSLGPFLGQRRRRTPLAISRVLCLQLCSELPSLEPRLFLLPAGGRGWPEQFPMPHSHHTLGLKVRLLPRSVRQVPVSLLVTNTAHPGSHRHSPSVSWPTTHQRHLDKRDIAQVLEQPRRSLQTPVRSGMYLPVRPRTSFPSIVHPPTHHARHPCSIHPPTHTSIFPSIHPTNSY